MQLWGEVAGVVQTHDLRDRPTWSVSSAETVAQRATYLIVTKDETCSFLERGLGF